MITAESLARRLAGLENIGTGPDGVRRLAWTDEEAATRGWFARQAAAIGLRVERDPAGNLWACPDDDPPWWGIGSHLDSVRGGGRFDGPLGVACAFEIAAAAPQPVAVLSFADEEGARFNTPTFGSKALAGRLDLPAVLARRDDEGASLREAMRTAGVDPDGVGGAPEWLGKLAAFVEIHIDQTTDLARAGEPVGLVSALAARTRLEVTLHGRADHAGTTPRRERRDALAAAARLIVGAEDLASHGDPPPVTVTTSRILASPNAPTTIAAEVRLWIDARSAEGFGAIGAWRAQLDEIAAGVSARTGVEIEIATASRSDAREFSSELRAALERAAEEVVGHPVPEFVCFAGHDAGVLAERLPAAMVFVRNETGVSHSPAEDVDLADAALAARVVERTLADAMVEASP
jgi:beta-ureidopropionase / N-carbamoyl-L-amino-acid hydrolase